MLQNDTERKVTNTYFFAECGNLRIEIQIFQRYWIPFRMN
jgi:hypothetical protein